MNKPPEPLTTEQCYGIAKKFTLEIEKHALQSQAAVVGMMRIMVDHRQVTLQNQVQVAEMEAREAAMGEARQRHAEAAVQRAADEKEWADKNAAKVAAQGGMALVDSTGHPYTQVETPSESEAVSA